MYIKYDEERLRNRLRTVCHASRVAFAAACAQQMFPLVRLLPKLSHEVTTASTPEAALAAVWAVADGSVIDLAEFQVQVESMVPAEDDPSWAPALSLAQNAVAAIAYGIRTAISVDGVQDAVWAARQIYEAADLMALERSSIDINAPDAESRLFEEETIQRATGAIEQLLEEVERHPTSWSLLREYAVASGEMWRWI